MFVYKMITTTPISFPAADFLLILYEFSSSVVLVLVFSNAGVATFSSSSSLVRADRCAEHKTIKQGKEGDDTYTTYKETCCGQK